MKKSILLLALVIQGLFTIVTNLAHAQQFILQSGALLDKDGTVTSGNIPPDSDQALVGRIIVNATTVINPTPVDSLSVVVEGTLAEITNLTAAYLYQGSTLLDAEQLIIPQRTLVVDMQVGSTGLQVFELQRILNTDTNTQIAASGPHSPGYENAIFDAAVEAAVIKYQTLHSLPVTGFVGPLTRGSMNSLEAVSPTYRPHAITTFRDLSHVVAVGQTASFSVKVDTGAVGGELAFNVYDASPLAASPSATNQLARIENFFLMDYDGPIKLVAMFGVKRPNIAYSVEASTNLVDWEDVGFISADNTTVLKEMPAMVNMTKYGEKAYFRLRESIP
ncbi:MAG: hypothetical protein RIT04_359 [Candidatus Parcubacteria bacterium]|jgi:hypothetical protein